MNSTMVEGHDVKGPSSSPDIPHHRGTVGEPQIQWFRKRLQKRRHDGWLRLGAFHHNWQRVHGNHDDLVDAPLVARLLEENVNAFIHGHAHKSSLAWLSQRVPVLSTGSAGVVIKARPPETPLQYQILQFRRNSLRRISRAFIAANHSWGADVTVGQDGLAEFQIDFADVHATFGRPVSSRRLPPQSADRSALVTGTLPEAWPPEYSADPHARVRISIAALLKLELDGRFLLVRNEYHPNTFAPFGGVFKVYATAETKLGELGFMPDRHAQNSEDVQRDLRGNVPMQSFTSLINWFEDQRGRELHDECLRRELREEFEQVHAPSELLNDIPQLTYERVRIVEEPVALLGEGRYQYRRIEVYQPSMQTPQARAASEAILRRWFDRLVGKDVVAIGESELKEMRLRSGEVLAATVNYLMSGQPNSQPDESPFSRHVGLGDAADLFHDFFAKGLSNTLGTEPEAPIQLLHRVEKNYSRSLVGRVQVHSRPCVLKYYPDGDQYLKKEVWALKALRKRGLAPKLLESGGTPGGPSFMLLDMVNGQRLSSFSQLKQRELVPLVLRQVLRLRAVSCKRYGYGEIVGTYPPVPNSPDLDVYVRNMVAHWKKRLDTLPLYMRTRGDLSFLVRWADETVSRHTQAPLWSALSNVPSLCHSDVKPDDILIVRESGRPNPVLLDFDNVFSFVPEFDLCKFHMYLLLEGVILSLDEYARTIAKIEPRASAGAVRGSLASVYPYVLTRLVNWGIPRKAQDTLEDVARVLRLLAPQGIVDSMLSAGS
jgi:hypothetical protein